MTTLHLFGERDNASVFLLSTTLKLLVLSLPSCTQVNRFQVNLRLQLTLGTSRQALLNFSNHLTMRASRDRAQRNLYVLNLPLDATTDQFEALFAQYGPVEHAVILATLDNLARRRGFILMANAAQARAAIDNLNGHVWHNYRIEVSFAIVQRSGTPFSQEAAEPLGGEGTPQSRPTDTCNRVSQASLAIVIVRPAF